MSRPVPIQPGPGQESVWAYPRPPAVVASSAHVRVRLADADGGTVLADTHRAYRVLETSHPPGWYLPPDDVDAALLRRSDRPATVCEFKGRATYWDVLLPRDREGGSDLVGALWSYEDPVRGYEALRGYLACPARDLVCTVDGEVVRPQEGDFYGGWITSDVVGPFKGGPGTWGW